MNEETQKKIQQSNYWYYAATQRELDYSLPIEYAYEAQP